MIRRYNGRALRLNRRLVLLPVILAAVAACATVLGIEDRPLRPDATPPDAGDAGPVDPCAHVRPPPPPEKDDAPDSVPPFYLAMRTLSFLGNESAFDLDSVCTCDTRPGTAADGGPSCVGPTAACDLEGGADNRADTFFSGYSDLVNIDQLSAVSTAAAEGARTILLYVSEYNGTANDREVRIGIMHSRGILDGSGCGTVAKGGDDAGAAKAPAGWCGRDKWTYPGALVVPASKVPVLRVKGWVTNGRLVFDTDVPISILVGDAVVAFGSPKGSGHLEKGGDGIWRLSDGVLAGRVPMTDLLAAIGMLPATKGDGGRKQLCEVSVFDSFKTTLCNQPDIRATSASDFQPGACDAMSAAMSLTAEQADVGEEYTPPAEDNPCTPDRVDASLYECP